MGGIGTAATKTACAANTYNQLLGRTNVDACNTCPISDPQYTSYPGAAYCTVPAINSDCESEESLCQLPPAVAITTASVLTTRMLTSSPPWSPDGYGWDATSLKCVQCRAGTYRAKSSPAGVECQDW